MSNLKRDIDILSIILIVFLIVAIAFLSFLIFKETSTDYELENGVICKYKTGSLDYPVFKKCDDGKIYQNQESYSELKSSQNLKKESSE